MTIEIGSIKIKSRNANHTAGFSFFKWLIFISGTSYASLLTFFVRRETLREARFFGMVLPAAFIILDSAVRVAVTAAALSPESIALTAFFIWVLTADLRDVFIRFFFAVTRMRFLDDLWFATFFPFI